MSIYNTILHSPVMCWTRLLLLQSEYVNFLFDKQWRKDFSLPCNTCVFWNSVFTIVKSENAILPRTHLRPPQFMRLKPNKTKLKNCLNMLKYDLKYWTQIYFCDYQLVHLVSTSKLFCQKHFLELFKTTYNWT